MIEKVISLKSTKRIVKGQIYDLSYLYNSITSRYRRVVGIIINGNDYSYSIDNFTDLQGNPLPCIDIVRKNRYILEASCGDIIRCRTNSLKYQLKGSLYKVVSYNSNKREVLLEGFGKPLKIYNFEYVEKSDSRDMLLESLETGIDNVVRNKTNDRKINIVSNKKLELIKEISKSIIDQNRHGMSVVDWSCRKSKLGTISSDFDDMLNMKFSDIIEMIDSSHE